MLMLLSIEKSRKAQSLLMVKHGCATVQVGDLNYRLQGCVISDEEVREHLAAGRIQASSDLNCCKRMHVPAL